MKFDFIPEICMLERIPFSRLVQAVECVSALLLSITKVRMRVVNFSNVIRKNR